MEIIKIAVFAVISTIVILLVKNDKPEIALVMTIVAGATLLSFILNYLENTLTVFSYITEKTAIDTALIKIILKITGIGYICEFATSICEDFGVKSLANKVSLAGKVIILAMAAPVVISALNLIIEII